MKNLTSNSIDEKKIKYSKKKISTRIKDIENDINELKRKREISSSNFIFDNIRKKQNEKINSNNNTLKNKSKNKNKYSKENNFVNNTMITSRVKPNKTIKKNNNGKDNINIILQSEVKYDKSKSKINNDRLNEILYKKINIYNNNINEKKNILFKSKSIHDKNKFRNKTKDKEKENKIKNKFDKGKDSKNKNKYRDYIKISNRNSQNKTRNYKDLLSKKMPVDNFNNNLSNNINNSKSPNFNYFSYEEKQIKNINKLKPKYLSGKVSDNDDNKENNDDDNICENNVQFKNITNNVITNHGISDLEYEFEERRLKKKINILKDKNKDMSEKLAIIHTNNIDLENKIKQQNDYHRNIINNIIQISKNNIYNNSNDDSNYFKDSNKNLNEISFKELLLNLMDTMYDYENDMMIQEFVKGVENLLKFSENLESTPKNTGRQEENLDTKIIKKISELIDMRNNLDNESNKYKALNEKNLDYYNFCNKMMKNLKIQNINQLEKYIQDLFIKNIRDGERMKKIKEALIYDNNNYSISSCEKIFNNKIKKINNPFSISSNNNKNFSYKQLQRKLIVNNNINNMNNNSLIKKNNFFNDNYSRLNNTDLFSNYKKNKLSCNNSVINKSNNSKYNSIFYDNPLSYAENSKDLNDVLFIPKNEKFHNHRVYNIKKENYDINDKIDNINKNRNKSELFFKKISYNNNNGAKNIYSQFINQRNIIKNEEDINYRNNDNSNNNDNNFRQQKLNFDDSLIKHIKHNSAY